MSRSGARALLGRAEILLQRHVAHSGGGQVHCYLHGGSRVRPVLPVAPMLSPSYGARRFSSSATDSKPKPHLLRILGACALGSGVAGAVTFSVMDPKSFSALSFAATDAMTPFIRLLDPETSHQLAVLSGEWGLTPRDFRPDPPSLETTLWGRRFANPLGMAAGFDKDGRCVDAMLALGFGFTEIGSVTPLPQPGNPKPRAFRLTEQKAVINRYGFNSAGIADVAARLGARQSRRLAEAAQEEKNQQAAGGAKSEPGKATQNVVRERVRDGILAVNLGKNKTTEDAAADFVQGVHSLGQFADVLVVNVSSPNTPGLRKLQGRTQLQELLQRVLAARSEMEWGKQGPPPLLLKIAPDLTTDDMADIAAVALSLKIDGLVVSNTTISRPDSVLGVLNADEVGGLSGKPLFDLSTAVLRQMYSLTKGQIPIIGCGGVYTGEDAYKKIRAGASLVQLYTSMVFEGAGVVPKIKKELATLLARDGFASVAEAVGADHREGGN